MKRFYQNCSASPCDDDKFVLQLDGKPIRTSGGSPLTAPTAALAAALAQEWNEQKETIDPETMPLTQIVFTILNQQATDRKDIEKQILAYLDTDLICYRTEEPEVLARRQKEAWDLWIDWFYKESGVCLSTTTGLKALSQDKAAHDFVEARVRNMGDQEFTALQIATGTCGSIVLALAFIKGDATAEQVFEAAQLEEIYRSEIYNESFYGQAPHQEKIQNAMKRDLAALRVFLNALS